MRCLAKQLERGLGVTYKTAWRMAKLIRQELMVDGDESFSGHVEIDETYLSAGKDEDHESDLIQISIRLPYLGW